MMLIFKVMFDANTITFDSQNTLFQVQTVPNAHIVYKCQSLHSSDPLHKWVGGRDFQKLKGGSKISVERA